MKALGHDDIMPYGRYEGKKMDEVPAGYLLWLLEKRRANIGVKSYILVNYKNLLEKARKK